MDEPRRNQCINLKEGMLNEISCELSIQMAKFNWLSTGHLRQLANQLAQCRSQVKRIFSWGVFWIWILYKPIRTESPSSQHAAKFGWTWLNLNDLECDFGWTWLDLNDLECDFGWTWDKSDPEFATKISNSTLQWTIVSLDTRHSKVRIIVFKVLYMFYLDPGLTSFCWYFLFWPVPFFAAFYLFSVTPHFYPMPIII